MKHKIIKRRQKKHIGKAELFEIEKCIGMLGDTQTMPNK